MTNITLQGLTPAQLMTLGDAALKAGDLAIARGFYKNLMRIAPYAPHVHARYGLTLRPHNRVLPMLEAMKALEAIPNASVYIGEGIATWLKNPAFVSDAKFMALAEEDLAIAPAGVVNWHWNLQTMLWAAQQAKHVPGDYVELGVYKGHTTQFLSRYLDFAAWDKRWWLYDTFEGIPQDQLDRGREHLTAAAYGEAFTYEEVRDRFASSPNITVVKGRVPEVFEETCPDQVSLIHIDLNNSSAEVAALDVLYDRLSPGGIIVFDDFGWATSSAQAKAETDWFQRRDLALFPLPTGQAVFVKPAG
ncbi:MAG: TylF/MycF/NovP-related O-methyltransferase [Phenylobacterium sp.]|uniref:TylF/MycF/NovP-related O-methyltransferase n=1 Tax=Phenylobacterium sp. TaxID=1871053 RepID=UPI002735480E|nr:TylF/MycF/NovP-related O-methyltransferase [Phenylobacterium sp.]MDP3174793.1 TylF/MycF/NovP-related O-methyltransferase [Phenylobacterium sp.]